jgi:murein DD-endopeptidase MepM/ murein hydrolase activator NlpD
LLNASVGVQRVIGRLRRPSIPPPDPSSIIEMRRRAAARHLRAGVGAAAASARLVPHGHRQRRPLTLPTTLSLPKTSLRSMAFGLGHEKTVGVAVAGIVLAASVLSVGTTRPAGDTGGTTGDGATPRLAVSGGADSGTALDPTAFGTVEQDYDSMAPNVSILIRIGDIELSEPTVEPQDEVADVVAAADVAAAPAAETVAVRGPFLDDGTLLKPVAVETTVADGASLVRTYKVKAGDTLSGIANKFDVSMKTLYWANDLPDRHDLHQGQILKIPPVSGLVVTVSATDTLASLAKQHKVSPAKVLKANGLEDENLVVGQVLILPGAKGKPLPEPKPVKPKATSRSTNRASSGGGGSVRPPRTYGGGSFRWPAPGGRISQYYHYGHYGIDIDGDSGDRIVAAASGTVTFAGWKSNGGGYQVWIAHGSGLYTTYNHMSSVSVGRGQRVGKGQRVGRLGATGFASGSHLHFEVWKGPIWNGGRRVNPLAYL